MGMKLSELKGTLPSSPNQFHCLNCGNQFPNEALIDNAGDLYCSKCSMKNKFNGEHQYCDIKHNDKISIMTFAYFKQTTILTVFMETAIVKTLNAPAPAIRIDTYTYWDRIKRLGAYQ